MTDPNYQENIGIRGSLSTGKDRSIETPGNFDQSTRPGYNKGRRLDRPGQVNDNARLLMSEHQGEILPNSKFPIIIPIPPQDARALGLRIPERDSVTRDTGRMNSKNSKLPPESSRSFQAKLERGLRSLTSRNTDRKSNLEQHRNLLPSFLTNAGGNLGIGNAARSIKKSNELVDSSDKPSDPGSKSMRQLYSMADSWSSDSVTSHSDSCTCCHGKEACPIHGKGIDKK
ncbi:uncharacterized protein LOC107269678 [Cephus cinctus]|uniref:Uncharacterized protein LOC107269678 n=1 Tax=Cephus cinctus TaxID=211228 RepID=A0AAJ7C1Q4_CEPCN|nr:uncharacterized protein LOC107269678 [Cephus cinctus]